MKHKTETINTDQEVQLDYIPDFQSTVFTVTGDYEAVEPIASHIQALESTPLPKTHNVAAKAIKAVTEAPETLTGRRAALAARLYDLTHGSNMYDLLMQRRAEERDLAMARRLGLVSTVYCQKHERELARLRSLG